MTQPNFLQVQNALSACVTFVDANASLTSSPYYLPKIHAMADRFEAATRDTDRVYSEWRVQRGQRMRHYRNMRLTYDKVLALADEHALDTVPNRRIIYTEEAALDALIGETVTWLTSQGEEWAWTAEYATTLTEMQSEAIRAAKESDAMFHRYSVIVKYRVAAYADAVALIREYAAEAKRDSKVGGGAETLVIDVL
ncbi:MAG: hypothetical protein ACI81R_003167 [Bradymonadia bacterium]|jgi:hypothetical protein